MSGCVLMTLVAAAVSGVLADEKSPSPAAGSGFGKEVRVPANTGFVTSVTEDGQVVTLIFDNLLVDINRTADGARGATDQTAIQTKVFTVNLPFSTDGKSVRMAMDVRGYVSADPEATARLVAVAGDVAKPLDLATEAVELKGKSKEAALKDSENAEGAMSGDFAERVEFSVVPHAANPVCQVTLFLVVERNTDTPESGGALLVVDSLDISMLKPGTGAYQPQARAGAAR